MFWFERSKNLPCQTCDINIRILSIFNVVLFLCALSLTRSLALSYTHRHTQETNISCCLLLFQHSCCCFEGHKSVPLTPSWQTTSGSFIRPEITSFIHCCWLLGVLHLGQRNTSYKTPSPCCKGWRNCSSFHCCLTGETSSWRSGLWTARLTSLEAHQIK